MYSNELTTILTDFATSPNFWEDFELIFGTQFDRIIVENIRNQWVTGDFSNLPPIQIVSSQVLGDANGGYSVDTNTIYLSDFLINGTPNQIITLLLEEIGHFIDAKVNQVDTLGDEGEYFASIIQQQTLSQQDLSRIKNEDDTAQVIFNNETINIEQNVTVPEVIFVRTLSTFNVQEGEQINSVAIFWSNVALVNVTVTAPGFSAFIIQGESSTVPLDPNTNSATVQIVPSGLVQGNLIDLIAGDDSIYQGDRNVTVTVRVVSVSDPNFSGENNSNGNIIDDESLISIDTNNNLVIEPIVGNNSNDGWIISRDGDNLIISDPNQTLNTNIANSSGDATNKITIPLNSFANSQPNSIIVNSLAGDDVLTIDFSKGNPIPDGEIIFNGGDDNDSLVLMGGTFTNTTYSYANENDGKINLDGKVINYISLEPITSTITSDNVILDYSTSAEIITVTNVSATQTKVDSTQGEVTTFNNPSKSLTINGGITGTNTFNLDSISSGFNADLNINGSGYINGDVVNINSDVTSNDFSIEQVRNINVTSGKAITTNNGNVNWTVGETINLPSGSSITSTKGNINLTGNGNATGDYSGIAINNSNIITSEGSIELRGTGGDNKDFNHGVNLLDGAVISSTDTATITITGTAGNGTNSNGIRLEGTNTKIQSNTGSIELIGKATSGFGINLLENTSLLSTSGEISLLGNTINLDNNITISTAGDVYINSDQDIDNGITSLGATVNITADNLHLNDTIKFSYNTTETRFDTINLTGAINLDNSTLDLDLSNYTPIIGNIYTLIDNDENDVVNGNFDGLAEGDIVVTIGSASIQITYQGDADNPLSENIGNGNDVQLYVTSNVPLSMGGTGLPDTIVGGLGENIIDGGGSNDSIVGSIFADTLKGGSGNDSLTGGNGNDRLDGGSGNDSLLGGNGDDIILAGSGNDTLIGSMGNDTLTGGSGNDFFRFNAPNEGIDRITDFKVGEDSIGISASGFGGGLMAGIPLSSSQFRSGAGVTTANNTTQKIIYDSTTGALFFDDDGNGSNSALQIATLNSRLALNHQAFMVI